MALRFNKNGSTWIISGYTSKASADLGYGVLAHNDNGTIKYSSLWNSSSVDNATPLRVNRNGAILVVLDENRPNNPAPPPPAGEE